MPRRRGALRRLTAPVAVAAAVTMSAALGVGTANAHVTANTTTVTQGGYGVVTVLVPNESDTSATTSVSVAVPRLKSVRTEAVPGWRAVIDKDPATAEAVRVTWTAVDGNPGIAVGQFGQFNIAGGPFPKQAVVELPAVQTYADGEKVEWNQPAGPGGAEPEHPAPALTLAAGSAGDHHSAPAATGSTDTDDTEASNDRTADDTARWIGGIGLVAGALGIVVGVGAWMRTRREGGDDA